MAQVYSIDNGGATLTAATAKTLVELSTGSGDQARIVDITVSSDASAAGNLLVELIVATTGTGTSYTPKKMNADAQASAADCTAKINDTVEPSSVTVLKVWNMPLPGGPFELQLPLGREHFVPVSSMYAIRCTTGLSSTKAYVNVAFEE